jgi:hypothetical protein
MTSDFLRRVASNPPFAFRRILGNFAERIWRNPAMVVFTISGATTYIPLTI